MNRREFIRRARRYARRHRLYFAFNPVEGKGGHGKMYLGDRVTTVPHGEIGVGLLASIMRDLNINRGEF